MLVWAAVVFALPRKGGILYVRCTIRAQSPPINLYQIHYCGLGRNDGLGMIQCGWRRIREYQIYMPRTWERGMVPVSLPQNGTLLLLLSLGCEEKAGGDRTWHEQNRSVGFPPQGSWLQKSPDESSVDIRSIHSPVCKVVHRFYFFYHQPLSLSFFFPFILLRPSTSKIENKTKYGPIDIRSVYHRHMREQHIQHVAQNPWHRGTEDVYTTKINKKNRTSDCDATIHAPLLRLTDQDQSS